MTSEIPVRTRWERRHDPYGVEYWRMDTALGMLKFTRHYDVDTQRTVYQAEGQQVKFDSLWDAAEFYQAIYIETSRIPANR